MKMKIDYYPESQNEVLSNLWLSDLIRELRYKVDVVDESDIKHSCYMVGLTMLNNMEAPYWSEVPKWKRLVSNWRRKDSQEWDRYFSDKSGFTLEKGKQYAINQLLELRAEKSPISVEMFMRSFEVILREYVREFEPGVKQKILSHLAPLISYAKAA